MSEKEKKKVAKRIAVKMTETRSYFDDFMDELSENMPEVDREVAFKFFAGGVVTALFVRENTLPSHVADALDDVEGLPDEVREQVYPVLLSEITESAIENAKGIVYAGDVCYCPKCKEERKTGKKPADVKTH